MTTNSPDRRVKRTRARLHEALASLIHEKPYEGVVVKEILARADVGRSTFYSHFRSKEELLESSIRDVLDVAGQSVGPTRDGSIADELLQSARQVFEHIERQRAAGKPLNTQVQTIVHERLQDLLVRRIAGRLNRSPADQRTSRRALPDDLMAQFVASTFVVVLEWWLDGNNTLGSAEVSEMMEDLIAPALVRATRG